MLDPRRMTTERLRDAIALEAELHGPFAVVLREKIDVVL
jgi:hypothetical protein